MGWESGVQPLYSTFYREFTTHSRRCFKYGGEGTILTPFSQTMIAALFLVIAFYSGSRRCLDLNCERAGGCKRGPFNSSSSSAAAASSVAEAASLFEWREIFPCTTYPPTHHTTPQSRCAYFKFSSFFARLKAAGLYEFEAFMRMLRMMMMIRGPFFLLKLTHSAAVI